MLAEEFPLWVPPKYYRAAGIKIDTQLRAVGAEAILESSIF